MQNKPIVNVLICDDDAVARFIHATVIRKSGLSENPALFHRARDVFEYITSEVEKAEAYLLFLDINMPDMNGWNLLDALKDHPAPPRIFVVIVSSSIEKTDHTKAMLYREVLGYIEKPMTVVRIQQLFSEGLFSALPHLLNQK
jgi:CheY-like chemotaxis protein